MKKFARSRETGYTIIQESQKGGGGGNGACLLTYASNPCLFESWRKKDREEDGRGREAVVANLPLLSFLISKKG